MKLSSEDIKKDSYVIVNIWHSQENGGHNTGHVSLQVTSKKGKPDEYYSFWPMMRHGRTAGKGSKYFKVKEGEFRLDYETDMAYEGLIEKTECNQLDFFEDLKEGFIPIYTNLKEGRFVCANSVERGAGDELIQIKPIPADERIVLFGLNCRDIRCKFKEMDPMGFRLVGSNLFACDSNNASQNCSSHAFSLLCAGGRFKESTRNGSFVNGSVTTPKGMLKYVTQYKKYEVKLKSESEEWGKLMLDDQNDSNSRPEISK